jgi:argininosuccinate lyase
VSGDQDTIRGIVSPANARPVVAGPSVDLERFPHPVYAETVLAPLFEGVKANFADHMTAINQAHLVMLVDTGILTAAQGRDIARALDAIEAETDRAALTYTGVHEDWFFLVEAELKRRLGPDMCGMLHTARSRNDMDHTQFKMALRTRTDAMLAALLALAGTLMDRARADRDTLIVAYTHGQPAQPTTFGHYLSAALEVLLADIARLQAARAALDLCPMGAAAITTTGFPIDRARVADLLGFAAPKRNSYGCIASVDYITGLYSALHLPFLHLGRVVQDFQFWTAFEVGQLHVPGSLVQISSIMPQKRNPVPVEHLRHLFSVAGGHCATILHTMHNTPFTDMNDSEGEVQQAGYAAFAAGGRAVALLQAFVAAVRIDTARAARTMDAAAVTVTELADTLVRAEGLSFRQAHHIAARTARAVVAAGQGLAQGHAAFAAAFAAETGRASSLTPDDYAQTVSAAAFVARRDRFGGPAPAAMDESLAAYADTLADLTRAQATGPARISAADSARRAAFDALKET